MIEEYRKEIDRIDEEIVRLFGERMAVAAKIAEYKQRYGLPTEVPSREAELIERVRELSGEELSDYTERLYETLLTLSKEYQNRKNGNTKEKL